MTKIGKYEYERCTKTTTCPICGRAKWCMISVDGLFALCTAVSEGSIKKWSTGWVHRLDKPCCPPVASPSFKACPELISLYETRLGRSTNDLIPLANHLQVRLDALQDLGAGLFRYGVWAFPMQNAAQEVIGLKCRNLNGHKWCVRRSRLGLYIPDSFSFHRPIVVCEGESDTAAALTAGLNALGLPSASAGKAYLVEFLNDHPAILIADNDEHGLGLHSARHAASLLHEDSKVVLNPDYKDLRQWLVAIQYKITLDQIMAFCV